MLDIIQKSADEHSLIIIMAKKGDEIFVKVSSEDPEVIASFMHTAKKTFAGRFGDMPFWPSVKTEDGTRIPDPDAKGEVVLDFTAAASAAITGDATDVKSEIDSLLALVGEQKKKQKGVAMIDGEVVDENGVPASSEEQEKQGIWRRTKSALDNERGSILLEPSPWKRVLLTSTAITTLGLGVIFGKPVIDSIMQKPSTQLVQTQETARSQEPTEGKGAKTQEAAEFQEETGVAEKKDTAVSEKIAEPREDQTPQHLYKDRLTGDSEAVMFSNEAWRQYTYIYGPIRTQGLYANKYYPKSPGWYSSDMQIAHQMVESEYYEGAESRVGARGPLQTMEVSIIETLEWLDWSRNRGVIQGYDGPKTSELRGKDGKPNRHAYRLAGEIMDLISENENLGRVWGKLYVAALSTPEFRAGYKRFDGGQTKKGRAELFQYYSGNAENYAKRVFFITDSLGHVKNELEAAEIQNVDNYMVMRVTRFSLEKNKLGLSKSKLDVMKRNLLTAQEMVGPLDSEKVRLVVPIPGTGLPGITKIYLETGTRSTEVSQLKEAVGSEAAAMGDLVVENGLYAFLGKFNEENSLQNTCSSCGELINKARELQSQGKSLEQLLSEHIGANGVVLNIVGAEEAHKKNNHELAEDLYNKARESIPEETRHTESAVGLMGILSMRIRDTRRAQGKTPDPIEPEELKKLRYRMSDFSPTDANLESLIEYREGMKTEAETIEDLVAGGADPRYALIMTESVYPAESMLREEGIVPDLVAEEVMAEWFAKIDGHKLENHIRRGLATIQKLEPALLNYGLTQEEIRMIKAKWLIHDIGKLGPPALDSDLQDIAIQMYEMNNVKISNPLALTVAVNIFDDNRELGESFVSALRNAEAETDRDKLGLGEPTESKEVRTWEGDIMTVAGYIKHRRWGEERLAILAQQGLVSPAVARDAAWHHTEERMEMPYFILGLIDKFEASTGRMFFDEKTLERRMRTPQEAFENTRKGCTTSLSKMDEERVWLWKHTFAELAKIS